MNKIQVLLFYYERPKFILSALKSIQKEKYKNWEVHFIDDGSKNNPGKPIVEKLFNEEELKKTYFYNTNDTVEEKLKRGASIFGKYANDAMYSSNADVSIMLCDDDAIYPNYFEYLNSFYTINKNINYAYSHVCVFDPFIEIIEDVPVRPHELNRFFQPINPQNMVDASQVSWRREAALNNNILFPYPKTYNLDSDLYGQMFSKFGPCYYTNFISQYKAFHFDQLGNKKDTIKMYETVEK
jgi:glycosyltransferase involved in cell wall biosynthesis